jgi:hypothetical protein
MRNGLQAIRDAAGAAVDAEDSGHRAGAPRFHANDAGMRMRRSHHRGVRLPGEIEIVGEASGAGEEPLILLAQYGAAYGAHRPRCVRKKSIDSASARSASGLL